VIEISNSCL